MAKLNQGKSVSEVGLFIDMAIPLPDCAEKREKAEWKRKQAKEKINQEAEKRKLPGPTLLK
jgi:hypothetical protein